MSEAAALPLSVADKDWDFTGFFLPLLQEHCLPDVIPTTRLVEVLRLYIEQGHLSPPATAGAAPSLPQNHYDFLMKQAFPNSVRYLLKQQSFRGDEGLLRFKEIVSMFFQVIDLVLSWIDHDSVTMLSVLASIFDVQKNISRASSASAVLDDWVRTLDVNPRFVEPSKVATRVAWDQLNSRLVGALASHFGSHNGFDVLLKRLNGPPMPLEALKTIVKILQRLRSLAGEELLTRVLPQLPKLVFERQLLDLETGDLRRVTKKDIEELDRAMRVVMVRGPDGERPEEICDKFCLAFALKCLKSPLQDKKFSGLAHIEESIESIAKERKLVYRPPVSVSQVGDIEKKVATLLGWLRDNRILELVFHRDNMRRELIVLTKKTVRFLQQEGELDLCHVTTLLDGILDHHHDKNRDVRDALYDTIIESSADRITNHEMGKLIWNTVRRMDPAKHFCARTVKLLRSVIDGSRDRALALEMTATVWQMVQDTSRAPPDAVQAALEALPRLAESMRIDFVPDCVANLEKKRSGLQSLKLLYEFVNRTPKNKRVDAAEALVVEREVFALALKELAFYKKTAIQRRHLLAKDGQERDWDTEVLAGLFPHLEAVDTRLALLSKLTDEARRLPEAEYLPELWRNSVELHLTQRESDMGLVWLCQMCQYEPALCGALFEVMLEGDKLSIFTRSETSLSCFLGVFYAVNHDKANLRLKTRENVLSFEEGYDWPYVGIHQLVTCLVHEAPQDLYTKHQDIIINLHLTINVGHVHNTDKFRLGIANMIFDMLAKGTKTDASQSTRWIDRLVSIVKSLVVLTKPKEEAPPAAANNNNNGAAGAAAGAAGAASGGVDWEEENKKPDLVVLSSDKDKVQSFLEMMGDGFPEEYRYTMCALLVKESNWNVEMAINDYLADSESKTVQMLEKAKTYRRYVKDDKADGAAAAAAAAAAAVKVPDGTPVAKLVAQRSQNYDTLFGLLESTRVDREAIWALLKMLPPDARLTRLLSHHDEGAIDWSMVLGNHASYQLLYSLELVRLSVPSEEDSSEQYVANTEWCRAFVHRGGFAYLFVLLKQIARVEARGRIEKACLGQLLKIVFYFMRSELDSSLAKSVDSAAASSGLNSMLFLSQSSTSALVGGAPFEQLGVLMFDLLAERSQIRSDVVASADKNSAKPEDKDEADVARYAAYLLAGSVLKEPQLLCHLADLPQFPARLCGILCAHDPTLRQHVLAQLLHLCREYNNNNISSSQGGRVHPVPFFVANSLSFIPTLLRDDAEKKYQRCSAVFALVCELLPRIDDADLEDTVRASSGAWIGGAETVPALSRLFGAVVRAVCEREGREVGGAFGGEDQALSGLFRLAAALLDRCDQETERLNDTLTKAVLEDCLFEKGSGTRCTVSATREAAFVLLQKLARRSKATWECVVRFLSVHHLNQEPASSWRPVEVIESKRTRFVGLRNLGATCYMNATLQQLFMMPELRNAVLSASVQPEKRVDADMLWQFQRVMATLLHSDSTWADTEPFVKTLRDGSGDPINTARQEDAYDFLTRFQEQLESQMGGTQNKVFSKMFSVGMCQEIECRNGHAKATEQQGEPVLQVDFGPTIEAALDSTFGLGGDPISDYRCDGCAAKVDIVKRHMIHSSSDQLVVMLRRFEWDYFAVGGNTRKKLQGHFEIPHRLNLSAYTESGIRQRRLGKQPVLKPEFEYELRGIVVHSGKTMDSGHYYSIIRDLDSGNWFKFDDRDVTPFPVEHLHENHPKFIGEAYLLLFQRVNDDLQKSQHLMDSQSMHNVDQAILHEVERANAQVVGQRRFLEMSYFSFLHDLLSRAPVDKAVDVFDRESWCQLAAVAAPPKEAKEQQQQQQQLVAPIEAPPVPQIMDENTACLAAQTAAVFVWETWTRARQQVGEHRVESLNLWVDGVLTDLFAHNVPACAWMAWQLLTKRHRWLRFFLLDCEDLYVRVAFVRWIGVVMQRLHVAEESCSPSLLRSVPLSDDTGQPQLPNSFVGLLGRLMDAVMSMFEASRACWRRFHEYFLLIRNMASLSDATRTHLACGLYPSYTRLLHPLALYVDYFMGEFSPFVRELPHDRQDRTHLGSKMQGESADLRHFFWSFYEIVRCLDVGAAVALPGRLVQPSKLDVNMWEKQDMLMSLIKQAYNAEANAMIISHFCFEQKRYTIMFTKMVGDCYFRETGMGVMEIVLGLVSLPDSMQQYRVEQLLHAVLTVLAERKAYNTAGMCSQLLKLFELFEREPLVVSYMLHTRHFWQTFIYHYVGNEKILSDAINKLVAMGYRSAEGVQWGQTALTKELTVAGARAVVMEEDTETEDLNDSVGTSLIASDGYPLEMSGDGMGVD